MNPAQEDAELAMQSEGMGVDPQIDDRLKAKAAGAVRQAKASREYMSFAVDNAQSDACS